MIAVMHTWEIALGKNQEALRFGKKVFDHEKETWGQEVYVMRQATGKTNRLVIFTLPDNAFK